MCMLSYNGLNKSLCDILPCLQENYLQHVKRVLVMFNIMLSYDNTYKWTSLHLTIIFALC